MCRRPIRMFRFLFSLLLLGVALSVQVQADPNRFNTPKRYLYVQPGQTVGGIVKALYPDDQDKWLDIARRLMIANPHAFENGNVSKMIVGSRIWTPYDHDNELVIDVDFVVADGWLQQIAMLIDEAGEIEGGGNSHAQSSGQTTASTSRRVPGGGLPGCARQAS